MAESVNIRAVAAAAEVSPGTASKILNDESCRIKVSPETRQRILNAAERLGYVPNINAKRLFSKRSGVLGLILPYSPDIMIAFGDRHIMQIMAGIGYVTIEKGMRFMLIFADSGFAARRDYLDLFRSKQIDGALIWGPLANHDFYRELDEHGYPHVFITTRPQYETDESRFFRQDYPDAVRQAVERLLEAGHRRIVWLSNVNEATTLYRELYKGVETALQKYGLTFEEAFVPTPCGYYYQDGRQAVAELLDSHVDFSAILTVGHDCARAAADVCRKYGYSVPADISVACCDGVHEDSGSPVISGPIMDNIRLGKAATNYLLAMIEGEKPKTVERVIPVAFRSGESIAQVSK